MYDVSEMIDGMFSYETKTCRSLTATYHKCELKMYLGKYRPGTFIDEIVIDYTTGSMGLFQLEMGKKTIGEFVLDLYIHDETMENVQPDNEIEVGDILNQPKNYVDASVALAMLGQTGVIGKGPNFGVPNMSGEFGKHVEELREKDSKKK